MKNERDWTKLNGQDVADFLDVCLEKAENRVKYLESRLAFVKGEVKAFREHKVAFVPPNVDLSEESCKNIAVGFWKFANEMAEDYQYQNYEYNGISNALTYLVNFLNMPDSKRDELPEWRTVLKRRFAEMYKNKSKKESSSD